MQIFKEEVIEGRAVDVVSMDFQEFDMIPCDLED